MENLENKIEQMTIQIEQLNERVNELEKQQHQKKQKKTINPKNSKALTRQIMEGAFSVEY